ncbi:hypothetical protein J4H92_09855 [Leucobacter weissii]|uniref:Uncharacterized protein n=1 Tax=Leucobacter weissii TaxID=1983706 RepID=A0A939MJS0_9MICO|nr:hypothetical protein [Leucobacter weissii]MBO1902249.1 hypothetical protein [Leucobacter weissii]
MDKATHNREKSNQAAKTPIDPKAPELREPDHLPWYIAEHLRHPKGPVSASDLLDETVSFLKGQREESRRREEPEIYAEFHILTGIQSDMSKVILMNGFGVIPSFIMLQALRLVPADAA